MKTAIAAIVLILSSLTFHAGAQTQPEAIAKFKAMQAAAPKGYPTLFVVDSSGYTPGGLPGDRACVMNLETIGKAYRVTQQGGLRDCQVFAPGALVYGRVHSVLGDVVDLLDTTGTKPKSRRFTVENISLVNPDTQ